MGSNLIIVCVRGAVVGDRRHGLHPRRPSSTGFGLGVIEGPHQGLLSRSLLDRGFSRVIMAIVLMVKRAACSARRSEKGAAMTTSPWPRPPALRLFTRAPSHRRRRSGRHSGGPLRGLFRVPDEGDVLRAVRVRLQPAAGLCGPALVRPCMFFGGASYICAHAVKVLGLSPELGILAGTRLCGRAGADCGVLAIRRSRHLFRDGDAGAGADVSSSSACRPSSPDGARGRPSGACRAVTLFGVIESPRTSNLLLCGLAISYHRLRHHLPHGAFAVRAVC